MQELTIILGVAAALLHGFAYVLYNRNAKLGQSKPNAASWSVWAFLATISAFSYLEMTGDVVATLQFFTVSLACIFTFIYVLAIGKFFSLKRREWGLLTLGLLATLIWWIFQSAAMANMIALFAFLVAYIPTLEGVWKDPFNEMSAPWAIWSFAFLITTVNVFLREVSFIAFVMPIVLLITHTVVAILSGKNRKRRFA